MNGEIRQVGWVRRAKPWDLYKLILTPIVCLGVLVVDPVIHMMAVGRYLRWV